MATITASTLNSLLGQEIDAATLEIIIDAAIDIINLYGIVDLPNMTGTAGSKSVSLESREAGAVKLVARAVYHAFYKGIDTMATGGVTVSAYDMLGNPTVMNTVETVARRLSEPDIDYG